MWGLKISGSCYLEGIDFKIEISVFDETIDTVGQDTLEIALPGPSPGICGHHSRYRSVGAKKGTELRRGLELSRQDRLWYQGQ
jgi:hypothetical protein